MRRADTARKVEDPLAWSGAGSSSVDIRFTRPLAGLNSTVAKVNPHGAQVEAQRTMGPHWGSLAGRHLVGVNRCRVEKTSSKIKTPGSLFFRAVPRLTVPIRACDGAYLVAFMN